MLVTVARGVFYGSGDWGVGGLGGYSGLKADPYGMTEWVRLPGYGMPLRDDGVGEAAG